MNRLEFLKLLSFTPLILSMKNLSDLKLFSDSLPVTSRMPVLFLGHGSPMNALEENEFVKGFREMAKKIERPKTILCISAHWYTRGIKVTAMPNPQVIYDFYGFPKELYQVQYPAPGNPVLAKQTADLLSTFQVEMNQDWGLDHGSWTVIKHMYPDADIPVIQLSIDYTRSSTFHFELAGLLSELRNKGVLIIGSGNIVHNLRLVDFKNFHVDNYGYEWAREARSIISESLLTGDFKSIIDYQKLGKSVELAVPTPEHFLPLLYILGLKHKADQTVLFNDKLLAGSLSMTSVYLG